jgi:hypothetical protein
VYSAKKSGRNRVIMNDLSAGKPAAALDPAPLRKAG